MNELQNVWLWKLDLPSVRNHSEQFLVSQYFLQVFLLGSWFRNVLSSLSKFKRNQVKYNSFEDEGNTFRDLINILFLIFQQCSNAIFSSEIRVCLFVIFHTWIRIELKLFRGSVKQFLISVCKRKNAIL